MPTAAAKSFSRIFRWARTTSRFTMMAIPLNRKLLLFLQSLCFLEQPRHE
jgi:hypothetical protein